jgi:hypothetical protein
MQSGFVQRTSPGAALRTSSAASIGILFLYGDQAPSSGDAGARLLTAALSRKRTYSLDFANHPFILELKGENHGARYFIITGDSLHQTARDSGAEREVQKQYLRGDQEGQVPGAGEIVDPLVRMDTQRDRGVGGVARKGEPCRKKMSLRNARASCVDSHGMRATSSSMSKRIAATTLIKKTSHCSDVLRSERS